MLDSSGIGIGLGVLAAIVLAFINPVLALIPLALIFLPLAFWPPGSSSSTPRRPRRPRAASRSRRRARASYDPRVPGDAS
jgi:hypothetical protein